ncbi:MAG: 30S ribosomal protein S20 [Deltaproteobacteria bacterium]|nr:30S ribosomal protein S20 [Deltaproteobacteria bacterium]
MAESTAAAKKRAVPKGRHLSQIKRERQNEKRYLANIVIRSRVKTALKKVRQAIEKKDKKAAQLELKMAMSVLGKAASKRILHPRNASRHISRLSQAVSTL